MVIKVKAVAKAAMQSGLVLCAGDVIAQTLELVHLLPKSKNEEIPVHKGAANISSLMNSSNSGFNPLALLSDTRYNIRRSVEWLCIGLTLHGPLFFYAFRYVDYLVGPVVNISNILKKTVLSQLLFFPPYLSLFLIYLNFLEDNISAQNTVKDILVTSFPSAFGAGCVFWPIANMLNFYKIKPQHRVLYVATVGTFWNTFLSTYTGKAKVYKQRNASPFS